MEQPAKITKLVSSLMILFYLLPGTHGFAISYNIHAISINDVGNKIKSSYAEATNKDDIAWHCLYEKDAAEMKINHYGLLAQELQEVFPNLVYESKDGYLSINYTELIPVLIQSVQELSSEVVELTAQLNEIQTQKK